MKWAVRVCGYIVPRRRDNISLGTAHPLRMSLSPELSWANKALRGNRDRFLYSSSDLRVMSNELVVSSRLSRYLFNHLSINAGTESLISHDYSAESEQMLIQNFF